MTTEGSNAPERPSAANRRVDGKYELLKELGRGGMGAVFLARNLGTGRQVALKLLLGDSATVSPDVLARFTREALVMGSVDHPNCAQIYDAGRDRDSETGTPYLVMEFLKGEDVSHLIERLGPLPPDLALRLTVQAARGLGAAHAAGVIHRDIKPANLFLARRPDEILVKVLDFGIGRLKSGEEDAAKHNVTKTGGTLGSPPYMSPEQVRGSKALNHSADLWSLGVTLYQMLSGELPYSYAESLPELLLAIHNGKPIPLVQRVPWAPAEVLVIVERAMCRDVAQRYASASEMIADILPLLQGSAALTETMLVGLPPEVRASAPPASVVPSAGDGFSAPMPTVGVTSVSHRLTAPMPAVRASSGTHAAVVTATPPMAAPVSSAAAKRSGAVVGVVVAVLVLGAGIGVFALVSQKSGSDPAPGMAAGAGATSEPAPRSIVSISPATASGAAQAAGGSAPPASGSATAIASAAPGASSAKAPPQASVRAPTTPKTKSDPFGGGNK